MRRLQRIKLLPILLISQLLLCACQKTPPTPINQITQQASMHKAYIQTNPFKIATWQRISKTHDTINIYIEGDGRVRRSRTSVTDDPTPKNALALQLATLDPTPSVVYIARPCQFSPDDLITVCDSKYWQQARYSTTVVNAIDQAINQIKTQSSAKKINLIGYSGGGTIAVLIAAKRNDIASIRTVAGNLDLLAMEKYHRSSPLNESLDPLDVAQQIKHIPQLHFVGKKDKVVPNQVAQNFCRAANMDKNQIVILENADHKTGWIENWPHLLRLQP